MPAEQVRHIIKDVKNMIRDGKVAEAIESITILASNCMSTHFRHGRDIHDRALNLAGQHARLIQAEAFGEIAFDNAQTEKNRISTASTILCNHLSDLLTPDLVPVSAPVLSPITNENLISTPTEAILGINNLKQIRWIAMGIDCAKPVCRILTADGMGTGFLIAPYVLMTNNHVIPSAVAAETTTIEFGYELPIGSSTPDMPARYRLNPSLLFCTDVDLDFTIVSVDTRSNLGPPLEDWRFLHLNVHADPVVGELVVIIQHPIGGPKQISMTSNSVLGVEPPFIHYSTDTMPGSSGSPVFNDLWQVVGLHHAEGPSRNSINGKPQYSNEGILMSAIRTKLGKTWPQLGVSQ